MLHQNFDSDEEKYFDIFIKELIDSGYINRAVYQPKSKLLSPSVKLKREEIMKTKTKIVDMFLLHNKEYTADWMIFWNDKAHGIFYERIDDVIKNKNIIFLTNRIKEQDISVVDVKGSFTRNQSAEFPIVQKWIYDKFKVYVQKIIISTHKGLFKDCFTPDEFTRTKTGKPKTIHYQVKCLNEFLEQFGI